MGEINGKENDNINDHADHDTWHYPVLRAGSEQAQCKEIA